MKKLPINIKLLISFFVCLICFFILEYTTDNQELKNSDKQMKEAVELTKRWFDIVKQEKEKRGIYSDANSNIPHNYLLGDDFTTITTTIGSINAKEISTNPDFAALVVMLVKQAKVKEGEKVGVILSGSFPSIAISTLAALQTLNLEVVLMSSLGASSYGANQPAATWLDIESWLIEKGNMNYNSIIVSRGAENDIGLGLSNEGIELLQIAADRNNRKLFLPKSLNESINEKVEIFRSNDISLLINIGGNQAALGACVHSVTIPTGLNWEIPLCNDSDRGVLQEINSIGIPVINFLNIKELSNRYGMDIAPGKNYCVSKKLYYKSKKNKIYLFITLLISILSVILLIPKMSIEQIDGS